MSNAPSTLIAAAPSSPPRRPERRMRLGELLVAAGKATEADIGRAVTEQRKRPGRKLGAILVAQGVISEVQLAETLAKTFGLPFVNLEEEPLLSEALALVPASIVLKYHVLPIDVRNGALVVAIDIDAILRESERARDVHSAKGEDAGITEQNSTVIRLVNKILIDAYRREASDIHLEPDGPKEPFRVRFRIDGECAVYHELPSGLAAPVVARVKIMADLDIAEHRKPQDGKIRFRVGESQLELRVATLPTVGGNEDVVLRLLPPSKPRPVDQMMLSPRNRRALEDVLRAPYGLFLCVGPTGSGKTTTLHSVLGALNTPDMKIWTAEDPVEITQPGLRQVQVNRKAGLDFAEAMRSFLRADPDVIMVGEIRDKETAMTAVEASLTGHLVLSTLHTNNAPETITRLLEMGLDPFGFADSLLGILAQRLVRALCPSCKEPCAATPAEIDVMQRTLDPNALAAALEGHGAHALSRGAGCDRCGGSGYKGRIAIHELLVVDDAIRASIAHATTIEAIRDLAVRGGMTTLLEDGIAKARAGATGMRQVLASCSR